MTTVKYKISEGSIPSLSGASAGLACSVFGLILGPPTLGATFYISIAGLANSLHSVSTDCFD